ncbi:S24 family peptidase [Alistipes dispar]|jgi:phage repressor protein C with HTH and peptisase S24 domain|uniref:S24 family peptidase n=1 Tax=Alistipes dispar TaxID=2585119 RepID=UPI00206C26D6|nr:MAG TPA: putative transcriptional regulator [Caudoviricetes sp.]
MKAINRVFEYINAKGLKPTRLEKEIGLSNGYLRTQEKRDADLGEGILLKILDNCLDINPLWLLTGKGDMLNTPPQPAPAHEETPIAYKSKEGIPLIPIDAMAGALTENSQAVMEYECEHYVIPMFKGAEFLIPVKGDSMQPKYYSGDIVACKRLPLNTFFQWNRTYVIDSEQGVLIKRVKKGEDDNHIILVSDNPEYDPFTLEKSGIYSLALVIGVVRAE